MIEFLSLTVSKTIDMVGTRLGMEKYRLIILALKISSGLLLVFDNAVAPAEAKLTHETSIKCVMWTKYKKG